MPGPKKIFRCLEGRLPELYAVVIELSVKSAAYMGSSGRRSEEGLVVLTDIVTYLFSIQGLIPAFQPEVQTIARQHIYPWLFSQRAGREPYGDDSHQYVAIRHRDPLPFLEY